MFIFTVVANCRAASKILRSEENKVPKLRFLFTPTSMPAESGEEKETPPLQSRKNVHFEQTSRRHNMLKPCAPLQFLPPRARELVKILGFDCCAILKRLRLNEFAEKVRNEIEDINAERKRAKEKSYEECGSQTETYKCSSCGESELKEFHNKFVQTETSKKVSIRIQTNEKDYREPVIRLLSRLTPGQLVAVSDFAQIICEPRPTTSAEVFNVREKLMDIYNLSERGPEAVEAERERELEMRRRATIINNSSMPSPPLEDLRATMRGSSDHGRVPPPPPIINYNPFNDIHDMDMEEDRFLYEENRRQLEEHRQRELEWNRMQQKQRDKEREQVMLELQNGRKNLFGRNNWNVRGRGRY